MTVKVEIFYILGCKACLAAHDELRAAAQESVSDIDWRELNVLEQLDYAVELGVLTLPSIVIDGKLAFTSMPTVAQLRAALIEHSGNDA